MQHDSIGCEENDLSDACIAWAKAACCTKNVPCIAENIRNQLNNTGAERNNLLYQIRFTAMNINETAICVKSIPELFKSIEIEKILCMVGHNESFQT